MGDRYDIYEKIGQGGTGRVHRAYDKAMSRQVVVKRIPTSGEDPSQAAETTKQMLAKVGALSPFHHPHMLTVFDVEANEGGVDVFMELIDGDNLSEVVKTAPLNWDDFRIVAMQSLDALLAAHHLNMPHRGLKPANILLTWMPSGAFQIKIADFGLATPIHHPSQAQGGPLDATCAPAHFTPPEQFEHKTLDVRSDVYSLGCCLYYILAGDYPFNGANDLEVTQAHLYHTVRPIHEIRDNIPSWACDWVMWMINRYPDDRPTSARDALTVFEQNEHVAKKAGSGTAAPNRPSRPTSPGAPSAATADHPGSASPGKAKPSSPPLEAASATAIGHRCLINEDRHLIDSTHGWFAIASGVGGLPYGDRASECVIRQLTREIGNPESDKADLSDLVASCHQAVSKLGAFLAPSSGIGATLTLLHHPSHTAPQSVLMAHIGNSTAYLHPADTRTLVRLSSDHTIDFPPALTAGDASGPSQAPPLLGRYLGQASPPDCEIRSIPLGPKDRLILCSDGITHALDEIEIATLSAAQPSAQELARALVKIADLRGGRDNATAVVMQFTPIPIRVFKKP